MQLPRPSERYSADEQARIQATLQRADADNHKRGRDIEINPGRLILTSPNGSRWSITVSNAGAISATAI